ncbi:MAG TPA: hypothetical protein VLJ16_08120, partial [Acidobacteriota bacterium]|nr:hypothetical protein [Acidobacteriota bacterium]
MKGCAVGVRSDEVIPPPQVFGAVGAKSGQHGILTYFVQPFDLPEKMAIPVALDGVKPLAP